MTYCYGVESVELSGKGLQNPLGIARLCAKLEGELNQAGFRLEVSSDLKRFDQVKLAVRGIRSAPMHDADVCDFSNERAFWMSLVDEGGQTVGIQAYRCDCIDTSLADWLPNYMIGVYMRRQEMMVPSHSKPPTGSMSEQLRGKLVYHGELWLSKNIKARQTIDVFSKLGSMIALLKWNPDAIWALTGYHMATRGYASRMGYSYLERGFLRWAWSSEGIEQVEYLAVASKAFLEHLVEEDMATISECLPELLLK
jgi:hypothetical protein